MSMLPSLLKFPVTTATGSPEIGVLHTPYGVGTGVAVNVADGVNVTVGGGVGVTVGVAATTVGLGDCPGICVGVSTGTTDVRSTLIWLVKPPFPFPKTKIACSELKSVTTTSGLPSLLKSPLAMARRSLPRPSMVTGAL